MAGIAFEAGQQVRLLCAAPAGPAVPSTPAVPSGLAAPFTACGGSTAPTAAITVIATDTRSMTEAEAIAETRRIASSFLLPPSSPLIFKKTDSALRGHVVAELTALMEATGYRRVVYCPANPSKGRTIRAGIYYIDKVPIDKTDFSFDPEFPATTSVLKKRFPDATAKRIIMPDAKNLDDMFYIVRLYNDGKTLFAGAADLFAEYLNQSTPGVRAERTESPSRTNWESEPDGLHESTLVLCGSTQSKPPQQDIPVAPMPLTVYDGSDDLTTWNTEAYSLQHSLILTIPHTHRTGKEVAVHLRTVMAQKVKQLVGEHRPDQLIIEGGATAWATLQALGWTQFQIVRQIAPGVVQMRADSGTLVTLKPGSYPWGGLFQSATLQGGQQSLSEGKMIAQGNP